MEDSDHSDETAIGANQAEQDDGDYFFFHNSTEEFDQAEEAAVQEHGTAVEVNRAGEDPEDRNGHFFIYEYTGDDIHSRVVDQEVAVLVEDQTPALFVSYSFLGLRSQDPRANSGQDQEEQEQEQWQQSPGRPLSSPLVIIDNKTAAISFATAAYAETETGTSSTLVLWAGGSAHTHDRSARKEWRERIWRAKTRAKGMVNVKGRPAGVAVLCKHAREPEWTDKLFAVCGAEDVTTVELLAIEEALKIAAQEGIAPLHGAFQKQPEEQHGTEERRLDVDSNDPLHLPHHQQDRPYSSAIVFTGSQTALHWINDTDLGSQSSQPVLRRVLRLHSLLADKGVGVVIRWAPRTGVHHSDRVGRRARQAAKACMWVMRMGKRLASVAVAGGGEWNRPGGDGEGPGPRAALLP